MTPKRGSLASSDEHQVAAEIRRQIGAEPHERIEVHGPQFDRVDGREPSADEAPATKEEFRALADLPADSMADLGMQKWNEDTGLWLFPGEWYDAIPAGLEVTTINERVEAFEPGVTDDDVRYGALAYGLVRNQ